MLLMRAHRVYKFSSNCIAVLVIVVLSFCFGCEKDITLDLPVAEEKIIVEGHIEPGLAPYVILTHNLPYFTSTDVNDLEQLFVHDAIITVSDGVGTYEMIEYCIDNMPDSLFVLASFYLGVDISDLQDFNFCVYTLELDSAGGLSSLFGTLGRTYELTVEVDNQTLSATTTLPWPVPLDTMWFEERPANDSLGQLWVRLTDPPAIGNYYRAFTQRLQKDEYFVPVKESVIQDKLINGTTVDLLFERGTITGQPDNNLGLFERGDTVVVKWCSIDYDHFQFWKTAQIEFDNVGNPIATSTQIASNINGGLGIWGGYGAILDTIIIK